MGESKSKRKRARVRERERERERQRKKREKTTQCVFACVSVCFEVFVSREHSLQRKKVCWQETHPAHFCHPHCWCYHLQQWKRISFHWSVQHRCIRTTEHAISQVMCLGVYRRTQGTEIRARLGLREGKDEVNNPPFGLLSPTISFLSPSLPP